MKRKYLWIVLGISYILASILVTIFYIYPRQKALTETKWYEAEVNNIAIDYVKSVHPTAGEPLVRKYLYTDYDRAVEAENVNREAKEYPFSAIEVWVRIDKIEYHLYLVKDSDGVLYVEKHEVEDIIYHR